jgi:hypothetical protein
VPNLSNSPLASWSDVQLQAALSSGPLLSLPRAGFLAATQLIEVALFQDPLSFFLIPFRSGGSVPFLLLGRETLEGVVN